MKKEELKMKKKIIIVIFLMAIFPLILCGCWNYREIDTLAIVAGMAIDKDPISNKYILTTEIITPQATGVTAIIGSELYTSEGDSVF